MGYNIKTIRDGQIYSPYSEFLGKGLERKAGKKNLERKAIKGLNLIVLLNEGIGDI